MLIPFRLALSVVECQKKKRGNLPALSLDYPGSETQGLNVAIPS